MKTGQHWKGGMKCDVALASFIRRLYIDARNGKGPFFRKAINAIEDFRQELLQTRHEATWAMALDAAAMVAPAYDHRVVAEHIKSIPCPPLQTTNEESE